jgi:glutamine phosphoribosylpyrophosphate amidotransferase
MGGLFGVVSGEHCAKALFYGTDYHSHLGTENAGMVLFGVGGFSNTIHSIWRDLDVTTLKYLHTDKMIAAIGLPEEELCLYCWRGR